MKEHLLPDDWIEQSLAFEPQGPDAPWGIAAQGTLRRHREPALSIREVQNLVYRALGWRDDPAFRGGPWLRSIPETDWAVRAAWHDRGGENYRPGLLWAAVQDNRSVDDELGALGCLHAAGFALVRSLRQEGSPDWHLKGNGRTFHVEVKSKGGEGEALDLLHSAVASAQLLDRSGRLRRYHVDVNSPRNEFVVPQMGGNGDLDRVVNAVFETAAPLTEWLGECAGPLRSVKTLLKADSGLHVEVDIRSPEFRLTVHLPGDDGRIVELNWKPTGLSRWFFTPFRTTAGWVPSRIEPGRLENVGGLLDSLLLRRGGSRGRQVRNAPDDTLFLIRWNAPPFWDDALADNSNDVDKLFSRLIAAAVEHREKVALALWTGSFKRVQRRVLLNGPARDLLGMPFVEDLRRRE